MPSASSRLPVIPDDRADDLHHLEYAKTADLVLFMAGNQFMAMPKLIEAFRRRHPHIDCIVYETLPPGLELRQILAGGALFRGRVIDLQPDIYTSVSTAAMAQLTEADKVAADAPFAYLHNALTLMVPCANPAAIAQVSDLGRPEVRVSQPNPENEDIAHHIIDMYRDAGGAALVERIMDDKVMAGTTLLTAVHHRQTPQWIVEGRVDVGPVWVTEMVHARGRKIACEEVAPGPDLDQHQRVTYYATALKAARNPDRARAFLDFLHSETAQQIYADFGFTPHHP
jgi:ABC-type molybdate transport system substrate-binding protein